MKKKVTIVLMVAALATTAQAQWTLIDDFDSYAPGDAATVTGGVWSSETDDSTVTVTPYGMLHINKLAGSGNWDGSVTDLTGTGAELAVGQTKTYFWRAHVTTDHVTSSWVYDCMMGLAPDITDIDQIDAWQDYSVMPFINNAPDTPFINANAPTTPWWAPMTRDTWTNVWIVVDNDAVDPTFDLYYSEGFFNPAQLVISDADWRNHPVNLDLNAFGFMAAGWDITEYTFDEVWYTDGADLTNPILPIPEPVTMALLGLGSLVVFRRRRKA